jgi:HSP20 family molecular chaperone IbpA
MAIRSVLQSLLAIPAAMPTSQLWQPPVDVYRITGGWLLKFELAGVASKDVTVTLQGSQVIVRGARLDHCIEEGCSLQRMEISYNLFERIVELPVDLSRASLSSEFSNGMLLLRITQGTGA